VKLVGGSSVLVLGKERVVLELLETVSVDKHSALLANKADLLKLISSQLLILQRGQVLDWYE
jgi:hypothetical protein